MTAGTGSFHLAVLGIPSAGWLAASAYLDSILSAVRAAYPSGVRLSFVVPKNWQPFQYRASLPDSVDRIECSAPRRWSIRWATNALATRLWLRHINLEATLRRHAVDVLFGLTLPFRYGRVATLSWIPDLQHRRLVEMFGKREHLARDELFMRAGRVATRVVVTSEVVGSDFAELAPAYAHKVRVLRPVTFVPASAYVHSPGAAVRMYDLPEKFIYVPNQLWKHKNHKSLFRAVELLKQRGLKVFVVLTGEPIDHRHPAHAGQLFRELAELGIWRQVAYLGVVPREHVLQLIRQSVCVVNPSLFEGWGLTVDEAGSVGKRVVLSDIPAHREQKPPHAVFFDPLDCDDLANKLAEVWQHTPPGPAAVLELRARKALPERLRAYGRAVVAVATEACEELRGGAQQDVASTRDK